FKGAYGLFASMSEAVTNIIHHAYNDGQTKEWRMFAQHKDEKLTVAICDQGIGIPGSLRQKPEIKEYLKSPIHFAKRRRDTALIEVAVQSTRSKTRLPHRGKGLKEMLELVKSGTVGGLRIFSKKGAFDYSASMKLETRKDYKTDINGTIIIWEISLESNNE
ncbi:ATP-binding protein, partial [Methylomonas lenta]|uniref:ATP-binding protein n=1 Tax=Methylomonas lenta TaxID=980561 RepID=UPI000B2D54B1